MSYTREYLDEVHQVTDGLSPDSIEKMVKELVALRKRGGRLFFLGVGGGAGNATHAVNDFRKIAGIESYTPTDNISELSARVNDEGWNTVFVNWLKGSRLRKKDALFIFSVGGGSRVKNATPALRSSARSLSHCSLKFIACPITLAAIVAPPATIC